MCGIRKLGVIIPIQLTDPHFRGRFLTFRGPYIVIYSYNNSQRDALFLNFILVNNSTCFGQIYCSSSGVLILYSQELVTSRQSI